jgi:FKBP-type peptidyl-prolyl cis-trans isomerase SlyD
VGARVNITRNAVVSLDVELSDIWGNLIQKSEQPVQYLHGGYGDIFPAVEAALEGKREHDRVEVRLEPQDAFGDYDEDLIVLVSRDRFPEGLEVGMRVEGEGDGASEGMLFTVTDMAEDKVVLDGNHPLAGMALKFECTVAGVRPATETELTNGSADDPTSVIMRVVP